MTRHLPSDLQHDASDTAFFPSLQKEMNRLFDQFRTGLPVPHYGTTSKAHTSIVPAIDVIEQDEAVEITAEMPGVQEADLDVSVTHDVLTLMGKKSAEHEVNEDNYHLIERQYGSFQRQIPLGFVPEDDAVAADFANGILKLKIKKPADQAKETRKIEIKSNGAT